MEEAHAEIDTRDVYSSNTSIVSQRGNGGPGDRKAGGRETRETVERGRLDQDRGHLIRWIGTRLTSGDMVDQFSIRDFGSRASTEPK